jgi:hypothetical protein
VRGYGADADADAYHADAYSLNVLRPEQKT